MAPREASQETEPDQGRDTRHAAGRGLEPSQTRRDEAPHTHDRFSRRRSRSSRSTIPVRRRFGPITRRPRPGTRTQLLRVSKFLRMGRCRGTNLVALAVDGEPDHGGRRVLREGREMESGKP